MAALADLNLLSPNLRGAHILNVLIMYDFVIALLAHSILHRSRILEASLLTHYN